MKKQKKFKLWTLVLITAICYFIFIICKQQTYIEERKLQYAQIQKNIYKETIKTEQLKQQKTLINTDEFVEKIARDKLGYVKDGEKIYIDTNK